MNSTLKTQYNISKDLILASGDFNIPSFKMPEVFEKALIDSNPAFRPSIDLLNEEYPNVLMKKLRENFKQFEVRDLVQIDFKG